MGDFFRSVLKKYAVDLKHWTKGAEQQGRSEESFIVEKFIRIPEFRPEPNSICGARSQFR
jgi:hypothetical protein